MSAHSPGPWYFHNNAAGYDELRSPNGEVIAMWGEWPALTKADAELIRSAPEMLELVRKIWLRGGIIPDDNDMRAMQALLARIDGATKEG
jgi:hypothetical protein